MSKGKGLSSLLFVFGFLFFHAQVHAQARPSSAPDSAGTIDIYCYDSDCSASEDDAAAQGKGGCRDGATPGVGFAGPASVPPSTIVGGITIDWANPPDSSPVPNPLGWTSGSWHGNGPDEQWGWFEKGDHLPVVGVDVHNITEPTPLTLQPGIIEVECSATKKPLQMPNGGGAVTDFNAYAQALTSALGPNATLSQMQAAIRADIRRQSENLLLESYVFCPNRAAGDGKTQLKVGNITVDRTGIAYCS